MKFSNKGSLSDVSFIEILKDASLSRLTGMIRSENGPVIKVVYFQKGAISFASSNEKSDRLTEVLKRAGKLTPEQVEDAQSRLKPNVSLGKTLVELGYISAKDLLWGARAQVDGILHQLLFWNQGKYQILEGTLPREIIHLNLTVPVVIFEGIMRSQNRDWILHHIGSPEAIYAVASDFEERSKEYKLPLTDIGNKLNGRRSLHDIAQSSGTDTFELCKTVVALEHLGLARSIQDEPLQMALNTLETDQSSDVSIENQPVPTEVERADELIRPAEVEAQPEEVQAKAMSETDTQSEITTTVPLAEDREADARQEGAIENEPVREAEPEKVLDVPAHNPVMEPALQTDIPPVVEERIEQEEDPAMAEDDQEESFSPEFRRHMQRPPKGISATKNRFTWKTVALILLALSAIIALALYYFGSSRQPDDANLSVPIEQSELEDPGQPQVTETRMETPIERVDPPPPPAADVQNDTEENTPVDLVRTGKLSDAADFWNERLAGQRNGYSIQVVIACQEKTVMDTFEALNYSDELILLPLLFKGQNCYRVLFGQYSTRQFALDAMDALPDVFLQQTSPASVVAFSKVLS